MDIWIIRTPELSNSRFTDTYNLILSIRGIFQFKSIALKDDSEVVKKLDYKPDYVSPNFLKYIEKVKRLDENKTFTEDELLNKCNEFRKEQDIGDDATVVLLTDLRNSQNHFNGIEFGGKKNIFVQTSDWQEYYSGSEERYPIAYHVVVSILIQNWFKSKEDAYAHLHQEPKGCIMDYCRNKSEVGLKLRTADICSTTLTSLQESNIKPALIIHTLAIIEEIRKNMLVKARWRLVAEPFTMTIKGSNKDIYFKDYGNLQISLNPQEKAFYTFFMGFNGKIYPKDLIHHIDSITAIYNGLDRNRAIKGSDEYIRLRERISNTCSSRASYDTLFSRIKTAFESALGKELAESYYIQGDVKYIPLNREYVKFEANNTLTVNK
jgi:hypothetical protein